MMVLHGMRIAIFAIAAIALAELGYEDNGGYKKRDTAALSSRTMAGTSVNHSPSIMVLKSRSNEEGLSDNKFSSSTQSSVANEQTNLAHQQKHWRAYYSMDEVSLPVSGHNLYIRKVIPRSLKTHQVKKSSAARALLFSSKNKVALSNQRTRYRSGALPSPKSSTVTKGRKSNDKARLNQSCGVIGRLQRRGQCASQMSRTQRSRRNRNVQVSSSVDPIPRPSATGGHPNTDRRTGASFQVLHRNEDPGHDSPQHGPRAQIGITGPANLQVGFSDGQFKTQIFPEGVSGRVHISDPKSFRATVGLGRSGKHTTSVAASHIRLDPESHPGGETRASARGPRGFRNKDMTNYNQNPLEVSSAERPMKDDMRGTSGLLGKFTAMSIESNGPTIDSISSHTNPRGR